MKNFIFMIFLLIFVFPIFSQTNETKQVVAVLPFKNIGLQKETADGITETFTTSLASRKKFIIIERSQIDKILNEMKLINTDDFSETQIVEIGKLAKAKIVVIGSVTKLGNNIVLNARMTDIETGTILQSESVQVDSEDKLFEGINVLSGIISGEKGPKMANNQMVKDKQNNQIQDINRSGKEIIIDLRFVERIDSKTLKKQENKKIDSPIKNISYVSHINKDGIFVDILFNNDLVAIYRRFDNNKKQELIRPKDLRIPVIFQGETRPFDYKENKENPEMNFVIVIPPPPENNINKQSEPDRKPDKQPK